MRLDSHLRFTFPTVIGLTQAILAPNDTSTTFTWNASVLVTPVPKLSLGGVYRKGAKTEFPEAFHLTLTNAGETTDLGTIPTAVPINVPDVFGGGLAVRATDTWTLLADVLRIRYSQASLPIEQANAYQTFGFGGNNAAYEELTDWTEFHVGAEHTWAGGSDWIFAVRVGYFSDPDHDGIKGVDAGQHHGTFGGGVVVRNRLQLDVAGDIAKNIRDFLFSAVVRF